MENTVDILNDILIRRYLLLSCTVVYNIIVYKQNLSTFNL